MIHIFKQTKGKDIGKMNFATVVNGRFISGSVRQGYERIAGVYKGIKAQQFGKHTGIVVQPATNYFNVKRWVDIQDDTTPTSSRLRMYEDGTIETLQEKPKKKYQPK